METPGQIIKSERERQNRSLHEISDRLKLSNAYLNAIEQDNYAYLPAEVFAKAYLRLYAAELGLDSNHVMDLYNSMGKEGEDENENHVVTETREDLSKKKSLTSAPMAVFSLLRKTGTSVINSFVSLIKRTPSPEIDLRSIKNIIHSLNVNFSSARDVFSFMSALKFILIAVFAVSVIGTAIMLNNPDTPVQAMPSVKQKQTITDTRDQAKPSVTQKQTIFDTPVQEKPLLIQKHAIPDTAEKRNSTLMASAPAMTVEEEKPQTVQAMSHEMVLEIIAEELTWASIGIDGGEKREKLLRAGETITLKADEHFNLTIGNAGGTKLILNGRELDKLGPYGKVIDVTLP
ncbi:MAG: DUF4115 domain-containing protein [Nitrospiraceae bacterium]|nr:MAG: DUF4115 domain-containing protein [Nitrospiraceae bacterium]